MRDLLVCVQAVMEVVEYLRDTWFDKAREAASVKANERAVEVALKATLALQVGTYACVYNWSQGAGQQDARIRCLRHTLGQDMRGPW
jgi:hypothetical protein